MQKGLFQRKKSESYVLSRVIILSAIGVKANRLVNSGTTFQVRDILGSKLLFWSFLKCKSRSLVINASITRTYNWFVGLHLIFY